MEKILKTLKEISVEVAQKEINHVQEGKWPEVTIQALKDSGLTGLLVPVESGGLGKGLLGLAKACEVLGYHCASSSMCYGMHNVATAVIAAKATDLQKEKYLVPIAQGKHITTLALSEPGTGANFYFPQTNLINHNEQLEVIGHKTFVTNGGHADSYVVSTVAIDPEANPNRFSCVVVDQQEKNLIWGEPWKGIGMKGNSSRKLELKNVFIPRENLIGAQGDQIWYVFNIIAPYFLMAMSGTYLGVAQAAFDEAQKHLKRREYGLSGSSLSQISVLQHRVGVLWAKLERTRRLIYYAGEYAETGDDGALAAILSAKAEVAHCAVDMANEVMTLVGGIGYRDNGRMSILLNDARAAHVMAPTTDILYTWLGRALLDQPILSD